MLTCDMDRRRRPNSKASDAAILRAIREMQPTTLREVMRRFGLTSTNAMFARLHSLEKRGLVSREPRISRTLRVTEKAVRELGLLKPITVMVGCRCHCGAVSFGVDACPVCRLNLREVG